MIPAFLSQRGTEVLIAVKAQPRASRTETAGTHGSELRIRLAAPPVDNAANRELLTFLAKQLECPRGSLRLVRGEKAAHKWIAVTGLTLAEVTRRLAGQDGAPRSGAGPGPRRGVGPTAS